MEHTGTRDGLGQHCGIAWSHSWTERGEVEAAGRCSRLAVVKGRTGEGGTGAEWLDSFGMQQAQVFFFFQRFIFITGSQTDSEEITS